MILKGPWGAVDRPTRVASDLASALTDLLARVECGRLIPASAPCVQAARLALFHQNCDARLDSTIK
jgi:hypothetical protein